MVPDRWARTIGAEGCSHVYKGSEFPSNIIAVGLPLSFLFVGFPLLGSLGAQEQVAQVVGSKFPTVCSPVRPHQDLFFSLSPVARTHIRGPAREAPAQFCAITGITVFWSNYNSICAAFQDVHF